MDDENNWLIVVVARGVHHLPIYSAVVSMAINTVLIDDIEEWIVRQVLNMPISDEKQKKISYVTAQKGRVYLRIIWTRK